MSTEPFFTDDDYFSGPPFSASMLDRAEGALGYKLPASYVQLMRERNGGTPRRSCFPTSFKTAWSPTHIKVSGIKGLGGEWGVDSVEGLGSVDLIQEWGYPDIGIVICELPSAGHETIMLDYRDCGATGEPRVVYVEGDRIEVLASTFEEFVARLSLCGEL
jgi:hypothetical protein